MTYLIVKHKKFRVDIEDYPVLNQYSWYIGKDGYLFSNFLKGFGKVKHRRLARFIMQAPKGMVVDHVNGDILDNSKSNLRVCTQMQNQQNKSISKSKKSSPYKGVYWHNQSNKWLVQIRRKSIGLFQDAEEAAKAYDAKAKELFGEFAKLNFERI